MLNESKAEVVYMHSSLVCLEKYFMIKKWKC